MPSQLVTNSMTLNDLEPFRNFCRHLSTFTTQRRAMLYAVYGTSCRKLVETFGMYLCIHVVGRYALFAFTVFHCFIQTSYACSNVYEGYVKACVQLCDNVLLAKFS